MLIKAASLYVCGDMEKQALIGNISNAGRAVGALLSSGASRGADLLGKGAKVIGSSPQFAGRTLGAAMVVSSLPQAAARAGNVYRATKNEYNDQGGY